LRSISFSPSGREAGYVDAKRTRAESRGAVHIDRGEHALGWCDVEIKYECKLLADQQLGLLPHALIRLLCRRANGSLSDQQWDAIQKLESHLDFFRDKSDKWDEIVFWNRRAKELLGLPGVES